MRWQTYDANEWLYPDTDIALDGTRDIVLEAARGTSVGYQILWEELPSDAELSWEWVSGGGEHSLRSEAVEMFQLVDAKVSENTGPDYSTVPVGTPADYVTRLAPFRVYDALRPVGRAFRVGGSKTALYVCFRIDEALPPQNYLGELSFEIGGQRAALSVRLEVFAAVVPQRETLALTNWFSLGNIADRHGLEKNSEPFWAMVRRYGEAMRRARQTHFIVDPGLIEIRKSVEGSYTFDFSRAERLIKLFLELGFSRIEGGHVATRNGWEDPRFVLVYDRGVEATSPEGYAFLAQYLNAWRQFLADKGWLDIIVQHLADEPIEQSATDYRVLSGIVRKHMPGVPLVDAVIDPGLDGALDIWVPTNRDFERHLADYERIRSDGDTLWFYTCWNPGGHYMNRFLDVPLLKTRLLHWGNYLYGLAGYLHWGFNYYFKDQDPFETNNPMLAPDVHSKRVPAGDTHIVYPGEDGPWLSMRLEAMRTGAEDYELLRIVDRADSALAEEIVRGCMTSFTEANTDPADFRRIRRRLLEAASAVQTGS